MDFEMNPSEINSIQKENFSKNKREFCQRERVLQSRPFILTLDPNNVCNLKCPLCPTGTGKMPSQGFLSFENFEKIYAKLRPYITITHLFNWGEPFLNKDLFKIISLLYNDGVFITTSTNLNIAMDSVLAEKIVCSGIADIIVSIDAATAETYSKYHIGGDFNLVMKNLSLLAEAKKKMNPSFKIFYDFIPFKHNEHEIQKAADIAASLGIDFRFEPAILMMGNISDPKVLFNKYKEEWLPKNINLWRYKTDGSFINSPTACTYLWRTITLRWDGEVFPCCVVYEEKGSMGNLLKQSFEEVWNGEKYVSARSLFSQSPLKCGAICNECFSNGAWKVTSQK